MKAWGGISTLGLGLSLLWTEGKKRGFTMGEIVGLMSKKPAQHAGISEFKGQVAIGYDGDLVFWDDETEFEVSNIISINSSSIQESNTDNQRNAPVQK